MICLTKTANFYFRTITTRRRLAQTSKTYYELLNITKDATAADIKKSFNQIVKENHPDIINTNKISDDEFKLIVEAYQHLKDPLKRKMYDTNLRYQHMEGRTDDPNNISVDASDFYRNRWYGFKKPDDDLREEYDIFSMKKNRFEEFFEKSRNKFLVFIGLLVAFEAFNMYRRNRYKKYLDFKRQLNDTGNMTDMHRYIIHREIKNNMETG